MPSADWRGGKILDVILADPKVDLVMCPITGALPSMGDRLAQRLVDAARSTNKPVFAIWGSPVGDEAAYRDILLPSGIPVFRTFANAVTAARAYFGYHGFRSRFRPSSLAARKSAAAKMARPFVRSDEDSSMAVLSAYGIAVPTHEVATSGAEAAKIAGRIGYPVVMKICSPTISHKSDAGLVRVGVRNGREVKDVFSSFMARAPDADGVMISELVTGGVECVVGVARDELFGPVVMLGSGGVLIEVLRDVTFRVPPFSRRDAQEMIGEVMVARQLQRQGSDRAALVNVLMKVQRLALDLADEVVELDINPLLVRSMGLGAVALDALVVPGGRPC
jgi:acyl-CoA synthetase (NDP forming)